MKKIIVVIGLLVYNFTSLFAWCIPDCSSVTSTAMTKQRGTIADRLDDFISVVHANVEQTDNQILIIQQEILTYRRLKARVLKEAMLLKRATKLTKQIKDNAADGIVVRMGEEK